MSLFDYKKSVEIANLYPSFAAIIMAAMRQADTLNLTFLRAHFPDLYEELYQRYNAPGGILQTDPENEERGKEK